MVPRVEEPQVRPGSAVNDWIKKPSPRVGQRTQEEVQRPVENEYDMDCQDGDPANNVSRGFVQQCTVQYLFSNSVDCWPFIIFVFYRFKVQCTSASLKVHWEVDALTGKYFYLRIGEIHLMR